MSERSIRWGVLPRYFGYRGDVIETQPRTEDAILAAMGAAGRKVRATSEPSLGLGGADLRRALARKLGHRRPCRPPPPRTHGQEPGRFRAARQPSWRAASDLAPGTLSLLRIIAALPEHPVSEGRRAAGR